jgi:hypothetical protein
MDLGSELDLVSASADYIKGVRKEFPKVNCKMCVGLPRATSTDPWSLKGVLIPDSSETWDQL